MEGAVTSLLTRNSAAFQRNDFRVLLDDRATYEFNDRHIDPASVVGALRVGLAVVVVGAAEHRSDIGLRGRNGVSYRETRHARSLLRARGHVWGLVEPISLFLMDA